MDRREYRSIDGLKERGVEKVCGLCPTPEVGHDLCLIRPSLVLCCTEGSLEKAVERRGGGQLGFNIRYNAILSGNWKH